VRIRYCSPVRARRELICNGDEAKISKIHASNKYPETRMLSQSIHNQRGRTNATNRKNLVGCVYDGMVERLSQVRDNPKGEVEFRVEFALTPQGPAPMLSFTPSEVAYHLLKFLSLRLARCFYPENIVNAPEIRFFRMNGKLFAATYSDFVPDETGVIQRREVAASRFYASPTDIRNAVLIASDENEHSLNPMLQGAVTNIHSVGLTLARPEANYHLTDGRTVFFEIDGIYLPRAYQSIINLDDKLSEQHWLFAMICAVIVKEYANRVWNSHKDDSFFKPFNGLRNQSLSRLATFFDLVFHTHTLGGLFDSPSDLGWTTATNYGSYNSSSSSICGFSKAIDREINDIFFETPK